MVGSCVNIFIHPDVQSNRYSASRKTDYCIVTVSIVLQGDGPRRCDATVPILDRWLVIDLSSQCRATGLECDPGKFWSIVISVARWMAPNGQVLT